MYIATVLISNIVTNNAAAALVFPIALDAAETTGVDRVLMSYCLMLGASASFMTPFGYTSVYALMLILKFAFCIVLSNLYIFLSNRTNLMIYGPGGYKVRRHACSEVPFL